MVLIGIDKLQKYSGLAGVIILWTGIVTAMNQAHLGLIDSRPISYLGVNPPTARLFSGSLLISSFLFINFAFYVHRRFHTAESLAQSPRPAKTPGPGLFITFSTKIIPFRYAFSRKTAKNSLSAGIFPLKLGIGSGSNRFMLYFLIGQAGQVIAAITPYGNKSNFKLIHTVAAFTLAFSLPLLIRQFAISQSGKRHHKLYLSLLRLEQLAFLIGIGLFVFTKGIAPLGEALPAIGFHIWIIVVTYTALVTKSRITPSAPNISKT